MTGLEECLSQRLTWLIGHWRNFDTTLRAPSRSELRREGIMNWFGEFWRECRPLPGELTEDLKALSVLALQTALGTQPRGRAKESRYLNWRCAR